MKMNRCEEEIDAIRLKLYERTKNMTGEEHTKWSNERGQKLAAQFGFKVVRIKFAIRTTKDNE